MDGPPGRLVNIGTHALHITCRGTGSPAVIFDAALGASSVSWILVQPEVARITRACAYDRAGFGWSEAGPLPRTAGRVATELRELLQRAGIPPPYLLVGHSFGGLVMRAFAARYRSETAGLVLLDPAHPEEWLEPAGHQRQQIERGVRLCRYGAAAARLGLARVVARLVRLGALGPARAAVGIISRGGLRREDEEILAPIWKLPPEARRPLARFWTEPKFYDALGSQIASIGQSAQEVASLPDEAYRDLPLTTVSSAAAGPDRLRWQERLAQRSAYGRHVVATDSGHWIPLDQPAIVVDAIVAMLQTIRGG